MANSPNLITRSTSRADLLALAVSDGTYEDVVETAKVDKAGHEVPATGVPDAGGQLWSNLVDDAVQRTIQSYYKSVKLWSVADATARDGLGSDDDLAAGDLLLQQDTGVFYKCASVDSETASTWTQLVKTAPQNAATAQVVELAENLASTSLTFLGVGWPTAAGHITAIDWVDGGGGNSGDPPAINGYTFSEVAGEAAAISLTSIEIDFDTTSAVDGDTWGFLLRTTTSGDLPLATVRIIA